MAGKPFRGAAFVAFISVLLSAEGPLRAQIQIPAIDPTGNRIFLPLPNTTQLLTPASSRGGWLGHHRGNSAAPVAPSQGHGLGALSGHHGGNAGPAVPAFTHPPDAAPCAQCGQTGCRGGACLRKSDGRHIIPRPALPTSHGKLGEIIMTPHRIVAPVGSEVVVLAGLCGGDGHFVINQPLEWMLSNDSVGQIIEVGGMEHPNFNRMVPPTSEKIDGQFARGRTGLKAKLLTRGTPTPVDDIDVLQGQTYVSLHSASPGTTWLTAVAPQASAWDKRRATTVIHWVDGVWNIPAPVTTSSGTVQPLTTLVSRLADGSGIPGWKVRYSILGGAPAEFVPTGSQTAEAETGTDGMATAQIRQQAGKVEPGTTQVRVDVIRPAVAGEPELIVESGLTGVTWSAPALTLRAIGPRTAGINEPYNYRVEVSNPGDQVARDVVVSSDDLGDGVQFVSSEPKPSVFGQRHEWRLGDLAPGQQPVAINIQLRGDSRGIKRSCFRVASQSDQLQTEACAETEVAAPCLGVRLDGPTAARVGDEFDFNIELVNQCDQPLENVRVAVQLDAGLSALALSNPIEANVGRLQFGEKKTLPLRLKATGSGVQCFALNVVADGGHTATGRRCIEVANVVMGQLLVETRGPQIAQRGQEVDVAVRVTNSGNVPLDSITLTNRFPASLEPISATSSYQRTWVGDDLALFIGRLNPGQMADLVVRYLARETDPQAVAQFTASTPSGAQAQQQWPIRIEPEAGGAAQPNANPPAENRGNPGSILIPGDPAGGLSVNVETITPSILADGRTAGRFRFTVTNSRATPDQNVRVVILTPPGLRLSGFDNSAAGPINLLGSNAEGTRHQLETIREMRPGEALAFVVEVVGSLPGNPVLEVQAASDNTLGSVNGQSSIRVVPGQ